MLSSIGLWYVCYKVGKDFTDLIRTGCIVGQSGGNAESSAEYQPLAIEEEDPDENDDEEGEPLGLPIDDSKHFQQVDVPPEGKTSLFEMTPLTK